MWLLRKLRKRKKIPAIVTPPDFMVATGLHYLDFLDALHKKVLFDWYLEIGCRTGVSLAPVRGKTIGVDPFFQVNQNAIGSKQEAHFFQQTSDAFFDSGFLKRADIKLSLTFLDGMHLIEYLLRDFINSEENSAPAAAVMIHDCCPFDHGMTTRNLNIIDELPHGSWTGDVWKILPILQTYRPDLHITVLDCAQTGLVLVSGLSPRNTVLKDNLDAILAEFQDLALIDYGAQKFFGSFKYTQATTFLTNADYWKDLAIDQGRALTPVKVTL